jgi:hypothetical protein
MEKEPKFSLRNLSDSRIVVVALAVAGVLFVKPPPLENTRLPVNEPQRFSPSEINARSWQDPFAAIEKHRLEVRKSAPDKADLHGVDNDVFSIARGPAQVLAVMLPGTPYSEDGETRRRIRYAVIAGLNAKHLVSADTERLRYLVRSPKDESRLDAVLIPYEWYLPTRAERDSPESPKRPVLVLWLRASDYAQRPIEQLTNLKDELTKPGGTVTKPGGKETKPGGKLTKPRERQPGQAETTWRIVGPFGSGALKAIIDEMPRHRQALGPPEPPVFRIYSPFATVPDKLLLEDVKPPLSNVQDLLNSRGVSLIRTIGDDRRLADTLIGELELRGQLRINLQSKDAPVSFKDACRPNAKPPVHPLSRIAVLAERDTLYGRSLLREFSVLGEERGYCVESFDYLRGLDGELPAPSEGGPREGPRSTVAERSSDDGNRTTSVELAAGQQQFDYLRRLAAELRDYDRRLRSSSPDGQGLRAIGVFGTDVHDKLLMLQALKPDFPSAVFFTTDLDARFLHPREQAWTRNLVVASSYALKLSEEFQGGAPPFRDSYQTAVYLSTMLAIDEGRRAAQKESIPRAMEISQGHVDNWFKTPRVFEIGRTEAFGFRNDVPASVKGQFDYDLFKSDRIHPAGSTYFPPLRALTLFMVFFLILLFVWVAPLTITGDARRRAIEWAKPRTRVHPIAALTVAVLLIQVGLAYLMTTQWPSVATWLSRDGAPLSAFEGISVWPAEAIRLFTFLLCVFLLLRSRVNLSENLDEIGRDFRLGTRREPREGTAPVLVLWQGYVRRESFRVAFVQTLVSAGVVLLIGWLLVMAFGEGDVSPTRGLRSRTVHERLQIPVFIMLCIVVLWTVNKVLWCRQFVKHLPHEPTAWPDEALESVRLRLGLPDPYLASWAKLDIIARRTKAVSGLVYYPFIVPSVLMLSTSSFFGSQRIPLGPVILALVGAAVAVVCARLLHASAEAARGKALQQIDDALVKQPTAETSVPLEQLKQLRAKVANLNEGAFAPFWEQTMFNAMLIPFAALGSSSLIEAWLPRLLNGL